MTDIPILSPLLLHLHLISRPLDSGPDERETADSPVSAIGEEAGADAFVHLGVYW